MEVPGLIEWDRKITHITEDKTEEKILMKLQLLTIKWQLLMKIVKKINN